MKAKKIIIVLLWIGALFYLFEFFLHLFGLPILEHDRIFMPTHDRYIALFALTYAGLLILISSNLKEYGRLFYLTIAGIFLSFLNGLWISSQGGYSPLFNVVTLDKDLSIIGYLFLLWFAALSVAMFYYHKNLKGTKSQKIKIDQNINKLKKRQ